MGDFGDGERMNAVSDSTRTVANLIREYAEARRTTNRDQLFEYGAELATIDSMMLADVSQAVDIALAELRPPAMLFEYVDNETGAIFDTGRSTRHGWRSAEHAVKEWTRQGRFSRPGITRYRNGKQEVRDGFTLRTFFEEVSA